MDFLRARYDRAELWLTEAIDARGDPGRAGQGHRRTWGRSHSDRGNYPRAAALLEEAERLSQDGG